MGAKDDNDLAREGKLPSDPAAGAEPVARTWPDVMPIDGREALPPFPVDALPAVLRDMVEAVAEHTQTPPDLAGLIGLAVVAATVSGKYDIACDDYREPLNLFVTAVMDSGDRKSAVFSAMAGPLRARDVQAATEHAQRTSENAAQLKVIDARIERRKRKGPAGGEGTPEDDLVELLRERDGLIAAPPPRLVVDDATQEVLAILLEQNSGRIALFSTEGADVFGTMGGRYSGGRANLGTYCCAYSGDPIRVDRVGRPPVSVARPLLTVALGIQPGALAVALKQAIFEQQGLMGRILYCAPATKRGYRRIGTKAPARSVIEAYEACVNALLDRTTEGVAEPILRVEGAARELLHTFFEDAEVRQRVGGDLRDLGSWGGKHVGNVMRAIGLLHCARHGRGDMPEAVALSTVRDGLKLAAYFVPHAAEALRLLGVDSSYDHAVRILAWIKREKRRVFSARDAHTATRGTRWTADDARRALEVLNSHGYVVAAPATETRGPGRPSERYLVNPRAHATST